VVAAVIVRGGRYLVTCRQAGVHLAGHWEFPGGKQQQGEALPECLARELREELALDAAIGNELLAVKHAYPARCVELHFFECTALNEPAPQLGQEMRWVAPHELRELRFPPADEELIRLLTDAAPET
jgi:mutator protein MutT